MKVELTPSQSAILRPLLDEVNNPFDCPLVIGQIVKGSTTIKATTGEKIRKLIQKERADAKARVLGEISQKA